MSLDIISSKRTDVPERLGRGTGAPSTEDFDDTFM